MKKRASLTILALALIAVISSGCAMAPGGIAASTTPINGRSYTNIGRVKTTDSFICLLGILPVSSGNNTRDAIDKAVEKRGGDAMINVTIETYFQHWILFSRRTTRVEGNVIRFDKQ